MATPWKPPAKIYIKGKLPREECAADHDEEGIDQTMERLGDIGEEISGWRNPVSESTDGNAIAFDFLPISDVTYPPATFEPFEQDLGEEV